MQTQKQEISVMQETLSALQQRIIMFNSKQISSQNNLVRLAASSSNMLTLGDIITGLRQHLVWQTPLSTALADIYSPANSLNLSQPIDVRYLIPPQSEGEDSINEQPPHRPSFKWYCDHIIDSSMLVVDQPQPKKVQRNRMSQQWGQVVQLLISNMNRKLQDKDQQQKVDDYIRGRFEKYPWISIKKTQGIYYKGLPSFMIRFAEKQHCSFGYYNLSTIVKEHFGSQCQVFRIVQNRLKDKITSTMVLIRNIPQAMNKYSLQSFIKKVAQPLWIQDIVEIDGCRSTIMRLSFLDQVFAINQLFSQKLFKDVKVCLHNRSQKIWKKDNQDQSYN